MNKDYSNYHRDEVYEENEKLFGNIFRKRANLAKKYAKSKGKILDIGCSTGVMLDIFKKDGWKTWGVEPSGSAKSAKRKGHKIVKNYFEKAKLPKNYFDLVVMNHVLEHMDDSELVLKKVNTLLKKGGIILVDVPNVGSLASKIYGKNWKYLLPNEHLHHFTPETLKKLLEKAGFKVVWTKTWSGLFDYANPFLELWQSLTGMKKRFFANVFGFPGALAATVFNRGTSMVTIGRKG